MGLRDWWQDDAETLERDNKMAAAADAAFDREFAAAADAGHLPPGCLDTRSEAERQGKPKCGVEPWPPHELAHAMSALVAAVRRRFSTEAVTSLRQVDAEFVDEEPEEVA